MKLAIFNIFNGNHKEVSFAGFGDNSEREFFQEKKNFTI